MEGASDKSSRGEDTSNFGVKHKITKFEDFKAEKGQNIHPQYTPLYKNLEREKK